MILVDANLLIYAHMRGHDRHLASRSWLDAQINSAAPVGIAWSALLAFLRVTTNPRAYAQPSSVKDACQQVEEWLSLDPVWVPQPGPRHADLLLNLVRITGTRGNLTSDAHLAALAIEHGLTLCSADSDFARFTGLRWINPLTA